VNRKLSLIITAAIFALAIIRGASAEESKTIERNGYQFYWSTKALVAGSSYTATGVLLGWDARSSGGNASFFISASTNSTAFVTLQNGTSSFYSLNQSSTIFLGSGDMVSDSFVRGTMINPIFYLSTLDAGASFYLDMSLLKKRDSEDPTGWGY
jgi:hypothetical protein